MVATKYIVGTSGFSFADWVGPYYPPGTRSGDMFDYYARHFEAVELNFTFYAIPNQTTIAKLSGNSPPGFAFWIKANQSFTHQCDLREASTFLDALEPMRQDSKLAGILLQFPQSFHRSAENRKYLASAIEALCAERLAVEFRHRSWEHPSVAGGLRERNVTLVVPDVPDLPGLYRTAKAILTSDTGYLRLHSRNKANWYAGDRDRYDYRYSDSELRDLLEQWSQVEQQAGRIYTFFNNCHGGQAAQNAESFRRILGQIE